MISDNVLMPIGSCCLVFILERPCAVAGMHNVQVS